MVRVAEAVAKPAYKVPSMRDVARTPANGRSLVSTFSGCGGSCLGFRLAGFTTRWASEFIPIAADTYAANNPKVPLDRRDIREVQPADVLELTGLDVGELDVLEGSPPCASFSTSGRTNAGWGKVEAYSGTEQRVDDLFWEFARIRDGLRPKVFVAENVSGLARGVSKGYFKMILARLSEGYRVAVRLLDAQWLGVPQARRRLIFIGVRDDLPAQPVHPAPLPYRYSISDVLPSLRELGAERVTVDPETGETVTLDAYAIASDYDRLKPGQSSKQHPNLIRLAYGRPSPTIVALSDVGVPAISHPHERRKFTLAELRVLASFPADFTLLGTYRQRAERIGRAVPPLMMRAVATTVRDEILSSCC